MPKLDWKKILLILGFVALSAAIGAAIYYLFFKPAPQVTPTEEVTPETITGLPIPGTGEIPSTEIPETQIPGTTGQIITRQPASPETPVDDIARGGLTKITDLSYETTSTISLDSTKENLMTYNNLTGQFYTLDNSGQKTLLTQKTFPGADNITWAPTSEKAIIEFPDGSNILYDFRNDKQITLPKNWTEFSFNGAESQIAYKDMDPNVDKRYLGVASPDGSNQKYLEFIGNKSDKINVGWSPNNQIVATYQESTNSNFTKIYFIGQNQENYRAIEVNGKNIETQYSPDGNRLIYSAQNTFSNHQPVLYVVDSAGDNIGKNHESLNLNTWADKCAFSDANTLYCAVPKELPEGAGWFPSLADNIGDYIYRVDLTSGNKSFIAEPQFDYAIETMVVSADGSTLYFTDKATKTVHQIKLK